MLALIDHHPEIDSCLHTWNPSCKWVAYIALALSLANADSLTVAGAGLIVAVTVLVISRLPLWLATRRLLPLLLFLLLLMLLTGLTLDPLDCSVLGLAFSSYGMRFGAVIVLKCLGIVILSLVLLGTTPTDRLFRSLLDLRVPARLVELLVFSYRLVYCLSAELESMRRAATCRGFECSISPKDLITLGRLAGALLCRGMDRSDRLHRAMLLRGYDGKPRAMALARPEPLDYAKTACSFLVAIILFTARWYA